MAQLPTQIHHLYIISDELLQHKVKLSISKFNTSTTHLKICTTLRLATACQMLLGGNISVSDIALRCGFSSASHFIRTFRKKFNTTPARYRRELRIEANASKRGQKALAHYAEREHFRADGVWSIEN